VRERPPNCPPFFFCSAICWDPLYRLLFSTTPQRVTEEARAARRKEEWRRIGCPHQPPRGGRA
jgi:hypothetical protein